MPFGQEYLMMSASQLYTPLTDALVELERRQKDKHLRKKVEKYFESYPLLPQLEAGPCGVVARALLTPIYELVYFMDISKHLPIKTVFCEFTKDKFVGVNFEKKCLGNMKFFREDLYGKKVVVASRRVVDFKKSEGKPLIDVLTNTGESLPSFHRRLLNSYFKESKLEIDDFSDWFVNASKFSKEFPYMRYLGLFIVHGILYDNFVTTEKRQDSFTRNKVIPAFKKLSETFGVPPLIVPINPVESESAHYWCYYPEKVRTLI